MNSKLWTVKAKDSKGHIILTGSVYAPNRRFAKWNYRTEIRAKYPLMYSFISSLTVSASPTKGA